ncbi:MAG: TRAP transporter small permease [Caldimonas sp.]|uniref:TRAP transporter small permease n=1 Tax=Caldimonas sp. TaxID=2838790 RepID=UPI00391A247A
MRRVLDALYDGAAVLAALCMIGTLAMVLGSVIDRFHTLPLRGMDAYAGYFMAAAAFLSLAHTLKRGEHIRVTLVLNALGTKGRRALELWSLSVAVGLSGLFAFYSARLVWQSRAFHDISTGIDATPLWIPQLAMAAGTLLLFIAFLDEWWLTACGRAAQVREAGV